MNEEHFIKDPFVYGGALNYSGTNVDKIIERMQRKMDAGAAYFLTQPVYSEQDIERIGLLRDRTKAKILAGVMPFVSFTNANFVKNEFAGINVPEEVVARYHKEMSREEAELVGAQLGTELAAKLSPVCDGYYFMLPFNRISMMEKIKLDSGIKSPV
jgi:homocysteine S-methyltransferase